MRAALSVVRALHGLIPLLGVARGFQPGSTRPLASISKGAGACARFTFEDIACHVTPTHP